MLRKPDKVEVLVEGARFIVEGIHYDSYRSDIGGYIKTSTQSVHQQELT